MVALECLFKAEIAATPTSNLQVVFTACSGSTVCRKRLICELSHLTQETVSAGTTTTVLRGLLPDTLYTVSLVPVYAEGDGKTMSENGKTRKTEL